MRQRPATQPLVAVGLIGLLCSAGCQQATHCLGETRGEASHAVGELLGAIASRFGPRERDPRYASLRPRLLRAALAPSRIYGDPSAWTRQDGEVREVAFGGGIQGGSYRMAVVPQVGEPRRAASYRGNFRLTRLAEGEYAWKVREELAVGPVSGEQLDRALRALLAGIESSGDGDLAPSLRAELPRASRALGRLLTLHGLSTRRGRDGAVSLDIEASLDPAGIAESHPRYSRFLNKYVMPMEVRLVLADPDGAHWLTSRFHEGRFTARTRVLDGHLVPLQGPPRRLPAELLAELDMTTKAGLFRVGMRELKADVSVLMGRSKRGFEAAFRQEPRWVLPFLIRPLMRSSLRRPFEDAGSLLAGTLREGAGTQTLLVRDIRLDVEESWIVRWLGGFVGGAVSAFRRGAEAEADAFSADALLALRADLLDRSEPAAGCAGK